MVMISTVMKKHGDVFAKIASADWSAISPYTGERTKLEALER